MSVYGEIIRQCGSKNTEAAASTSSAVRRMVSLVSHLSFFDTLFPVRLIQETGGGNGLETSGYMD